MPEIKKSELESMIATKAAEIAAKEIAALKAEYEAGQTKMRGEFQEMFEKTKKKSDAAKIITGEEAVKAFAGLVMVAAAAKCDGNRMVEYAKKNAPENKALQFAIEKSLEASVPEAGGVTVPRVLSSMVIEYLYAYTILDKVGVVPIPLPNGNVNFSSMTTAAAVAWVGETTGAGKTEPKFGEVSLNTKKLAALEPISNTLIRNNVVGIDGWLIKDLQKNFMLKLDYTLFHGVGTAYTPRGLVNRSPQTLGSSATQLTADHPVTMETMLKQANVPMAAPAFSMAPTMEGWLKSLKTTTGAYIYRDEMVKDKKINGIPYFTSTQHIMSGSGATEYGEIWLVDYSEVLWGIGQDMQIEVSKDASYVVDGTTYSAFQRDETLMRIIGEHDFNIKHGVSAVRGLFKKP